MKSNLQPNSSRVYFQFQKTYKQLQRRTKRWEKKEGNGERGRQTYYVEERSYNRGNKEEDRLPSKGR